MIAPLPSSRTSCTRAFAVSRKAGYVSFCRNETGRLLATLAATRGGTLAEFGTGCGVGTAWLRSGVREDARIITAELDPKLAKAAAEIFADDPQVEVLAADWSTLLDQGPFSLLFLDSGKPKAVGPDAVVGPDGGGRHRRARRLHALRDVAADLRRPGRHAARGVAQRRAVHRRRGDGRRRRLRRDRHPPLNTDSSRGSQRGNSQRSADESV